MENDQQLTLGTLFSADPKPLLDALAKVKAQLGDIAKAAQQLQGSMGQMNTATKASSSAMDTMGSSLKKVDTATKNVAASQSKASVAAGQVTTAYSGLNKQISHIHGGMERLAAAFKVTASYGIAATAIYSVVTAFKSGAQAIVDYDQGLKNLQAITGATDAEVSAMGETIKSVARDTKFSATEVADGMTLLGQAGLSAGESIAAMKDTAILATGTMSDMKTSTDLVSTTIRAFNLSATDSGRIVDVMANAMNKSKLDIDKLRTAFNYVGASAHQSGLSLEETASSMMVLSNAGLRASTIGTGLRQVLARVVKPSEDMAASLAQVGLTVDQLNPSTAGWSGTVQALTSVLYDSNTKTVDMAKAFQLFGLRGAQAAAIIVQSFIGGQYQDAMGAVYEIGSAQEMAAIQAEGLGIKFKNLQDRAKLVAVAFGEAGATGAIGSFLDLVRGGLSVLESFAGSIAGKVIFQLGAAAAAFKTATLAGTAFMAVFGNVVPIKILTSTFATLTTTLGKGGLVAALTTAAYSIEALVRAFGPLKLILAGVAAAILVYRAALQNQVKDAEIAVVENQKIVKSLESYQFALDETAKKVQSAQSGTQAAQVANDAYIATLQRLITAHPELQGQIQLSTEAIEQNSKVLDDFASDKHIASLQSIVNLYNEYGKAAERAQFWSGVWEGLKVAIATVGDAFQKVVDGFATGWDIIAKGFGMLFINVSEAVAKIPFIGTAMAAGFRAVGETLMTAKDNVVNFYTELGKGSDAAKAKQAEQAALIDQTAQKYVGLGENAKKTYDQIRAELEQTGGADKAFVDGVVARVEELRSKQQVSAAQIKDAVTTSVNEMNAAWQAYYDQQDERGQYQVQQAWERLQKQAKDYADFLTKKAQDGEISLEKMQTLMDEYWNRELVAFQDKETKKTDTSSKEDEKRLKNLEKTIEESLKLQEKLEQDIVAARQATLPEHEKVNAQIKAAYEALVAAEKELANTTTEEERLAALRKLAIATELYNALAAKSDAYAEKERSRHESQKTEELKYTSSLYEYWKKYYEDIGYQVTMYTSTYVDTMTKADEKQKESAEALEKAKKDIFNRIEQAWKTSTGAMTKEGLKPYDSAKEAANKYKTWLETQDFKLLTKFKAKGSEEKDLSEEFTYVFNKLKDLNIELAKEHKLTITHNIAAAIERIQDLIDKIAKIPRDVYVNVHINSSGTSAGADAPLTEGVSAATSEISTMTETIEQGAEYPVSFVGSASSEKPLTEKLEELGSELGGFQSQLNEGAKFDADFSSVTQGAEISADNMTSSFTSAINTIINKLDDLIGKIIEMMDITQKESKEDNGVFYTTHYEPGLFGWHIWKTAYDKKTGEKLWRKKLMRTGGAVSNMGMDSGGKLPGYGGGDTVPAMLEKGEYVINKSAVQRYGTGFFDALNGMVAKFGSGGSVVVPVYEEILSKYFKGDAHRNPIDIASDWYKAFQGADESEKNEILNALKLKAYAHEKSNYGYSEDASKRYYDRIERQSGIKTLIGYLVQAIHGKGYSRYVSTMSNLGKVFGQHGGYIPGFGGGDTVPAMLEQGGYVVRKEAVKNYGTGMMNAINSGVAKFMAGGIVKPRIVIDQPQSSIQTFASGGPVMGAAASASGSPINITISPMFMTGDRNSVKQVATMLRDEIKNIDHRYGVG